MAAITSAASGNWSAGGTWVGNVPPANGDSAIILLAHTVTVDVSTTVGPNGATGVAAITLQGSLVINAPLTLKGDLLQDRNRPITGDSTGSNTGSLTWVTPGGSTYKWQITSSGTAALSTISFTGTASNRFVVTTTQGGGGNTWFDGHTNWSASWTLSYVTMSYMGDGSNPGIYSDATSPDVNISNVLFSHCGDIYWLSNSGTRDMIVTNVDVRNSLGNPEILKLACPVDKVSGTRTVTNLTAYSAALRSVTLQVRDLTINGLYLYDVKIDNSNAVRNLWKKKFMVCDLSTSEIINTISGRSGNVLQDSIYLFNQSSHYILEAGDNAATNNIYQDLIFDGYGVWSGDAGDCVIPNVPCTVQRCLNINKAGTLGTHLVATALSGSYLNNTIYKSFGLAVGESVGAATQVSNFKDNLIVSPYLWSDGVSAGDGIHEQTAFVKQSAMTVDYNCYFGSMDPNGVAYMGLPVKAVVGNTTAQAGTTATHVVGTGLPFASVVAGDFVWHSSKGVARIATWTDGNTLELAGAGIVGLVSTDVVQVRSSYWSTAGQKYGDDTRGLHDLNVDPQFRDNTRTIATWSTSLGGLGTIADVGAQIVKINGFDSTGAPVTPPAGYSIDAALAYIRFGFTPQNMSLATASDTGSFVGALAPVPAGSPLARPLVGGFGGFLGGM